MLFWRGHYSLGETKFTSKKDVLGVHYSLVKNVRGEQNSLVSKVQGDIKF